MEFIYELLFEVIVEGTLDIGTSRKIPVFFRILALIGFLAIYVGTTCLLLIYGVDALRSNDCLCILTAMVVLLGCIFLTVKKLRKDQAAE